MRRLRVYAVVLLALPPVASLCGCGEEADPPGPEGRASSASGNQQAAPGAPGAQNESGVPPAQSGGVALSDVLASWESGKKDVAVKQLLSIRWDEPAVFADMPIMVLSEKDFRSLPRDERTRIQQELIELVGPLRNMARHAWSIGEKAQASGDKQTAKAHYEAVLHLGQALASPERVLLIQQVGKAITIGTQKRSSAVE